MPLLFSDSTMRAYVNAAQSKTHGTYVTGMADVTATLDDVRYFASHAMSSRFARWQLAESSRRVRAQIQCVLHGMLLNAVSDVAVAALASRPHFK